MKVVYQWSLVWMTFGACCCAAAPIDETRFDH